MADESPSLLKRVDNLVRGAANGLTFGLADKIAGYMDSVVGSGTAAENIAKQEEASREASKDATYTASNAVGSFVGVGKVLKAAQGVRSFLGFGRTAAPAATGATVTAPAATGTAGPVVISVPVPATATTAIVAAPSKWASVWHGITLPFRYPRTTLAAVLATGAYLAKEQIHDTLTKKRPDAAQAPYDAKADELQRARANALRRGVDDGQRPGAVPLVLPSAADTKLSEDEKARRLLAERRASSRAAADVAANIAIDAAAGSPGAAELRGRATWGKFLASVSEAGERRVAYEVASSAGRRPMVFRNADGVQVQVDPHDNVFVINDPRLLTSRPGSTAVELEVFPVTPPGGSEPSRFDTIKIERFPSVAAPALRRGYAPATSAVRTAGVAPN